MTLTPLAILLAAQLHAQAVARVMQDGVWGLINQQGEVLVEPRYTYINEFVGDVAVYEDDYLLGLLHASGRVMTPAKYEAIEFFMKPGDDMQRIETHARVLLDEQWGMIDLSTGELVIPTEWDYINYFGNGRVFANKGGREVMRQGFMEYDGGKWALFSSDGRQMTEPVYEYPEPYMGISTKVTFEGYEGLLGTDATWRIQPKYDQFKTLDIKGQPTQYLAVRKGQLWGWTDRSGKGFVEPEFEEVRWQTGRTGRVIVKRRGKWGVMDFTGNQLVSTEYDNVFSYDAAGQLLVQLGDKYGLLDKRGAVIEPTTHGSYLEVDGKWLLLDKAYADFSSPGYGLVAAEADNGKYALLRTEPLKVLTDPVFDYAEPVFAGYFKTMKNGAWGLTNATGETVIDHKLNDIQAINANWAVGIDAGQWKFIGRDGQLQAADNYGTIRAMDRRRIGVMKAGKWGLLGPDLKMILDHQYESIEPFGNDALLVYDGTHYFTVDTLGQPLSQTPIEEILPIEFGLSVAKTADGWGVLGEEGRFLFTPNKQALFVLGEKRLLEKTRRRPNRPLARHYGRPPQHLHRRRHPRQPRPRQLYGHRQRHHATAGRRPLLSLRHQRHPAQRDGV